MKAVLTTVTKSKKKTHVFECGVSFAATYGTTLQFIELYGPITAMRAIWSDIVQGRKNGDIASIDTKLMVEGKQVTLQVRGGTSFIKREIDKRIYIMDHGWTDAERRFFMGGDLDTPSVYFMDAFRINVPDVAILPEWIPDFWRLGVKKGLVFPIKTYGALFAWTIKLVGNNEQTWDDLTKEFILNG